MEKLRNNLVFEYLLVLSLSLALILAQSGKLHVHLENDAHLASHVSGVHLESIRHGAGQSNQYDEQSVTAVDVSLGKWLSNSNFTNSLVIILFFVGFLLCLPRRRVEFRWEYNETLFPSCFYLFKPPLRAPPVK